MIRDLHHLTIADAGRAIAARELSPVTLVEALLERISMLNPRIDAFVTLTAQRALDQARTAEAEITAGRYRGPLHGIPFGLKDVFSTAGVLTSGHSRLGIGNWPSEDATAVSRLYAAGGILMGKLSTHEFAHGGPSFDLPWPPARNPWDTTCQPGGSSSGAGAAVAAGFVPGALGTDTGGSIRNPAALCGVVGLKPTYGRVSRRGVIVNSYSLDHVGPLAWTVEDAALLLQAIAGVDPVDPASSAQPVPNYRAALTGDIRGTRIGVVRHFWEDDLPANDEVRAAMEDAIGVLEKLGASISDTRMRPLHDYYAVKNILAEGELFAVHAEDLRNRPGDFGADFFARVAPACLFTADDYVQASRERRRMVAEMQPLFEKFDVLVTAGTYGPAPRIDAHRTLSNWQKPSISTPFNVTGGPALAQCIGYTKGGMPLSMQIAGRPFDEAAVLRAADAYERATPWRARRPALDPSAPPSTNRISDETAIAVADVDGATRAWVMHAVRGAGLALSERQFEAVCAAAPYLQEMAARVRCRRHWSEEPSSVFLM